MTGAGDRPPLDVPPIEVLNDPAFTPGRKQLGALVDLVASGEEGAAKAAARALGRAQSPVVARIVAGFEGRDAGARARLADALRVLAGHGEDEAVREALERALADGDPRVRKAAARGLGKLGGDRALAALDQAAAREAHAGALRAIDKARALLGRDATRVEAATIDVDATLPAVVEVVFRCRRGLEPTLEGEIRDRLGLDPERIDPGEVAVRSRGPLALLHRVRTALDVSFSVELQDGSADAATNAAHLLASQPSEQILVGLTRGPVRYRLAWRTGKRRASTAAVTKKVASATSGAIVDDPRAASWSVLVDDDGRRALLTPRSVDPRFAYRVADVPAASHPTIAAALAREAGVREDDIVWDPFVGSGLELCERALLGPFRALFGTDVDPRAIERARVNLTGAKARAFDLQIQDARRASIAGVTLVMTNPPMGRRLVRGGALDELLAETLWNAVRLLVRGGRIVLLSPRPRLTRDVLASAGLVSTMERAVDLGGFEAFLQRFEKPTTAAARRGARAART